MEKSLNEVMDFDHVIRVNEDGTITDNVEDTPFHYPHFELTMVETDVEGVWEEEFSLPEGWELLRGFTGQYGYNGPVMHPSEYIGGGLERHIRETPGYYVALVVETQCNYTGEFCNEDDGCQCESDGWAVAYRPLED